MWILGAFMIAVLVANVVLVVVVGITCKPNGE
jgi:hypothetical protein